MNYSDVKKVVWWMPMRCGSRSMKEVLRQLDFVNGTTKRPLANAAPTHELRFPEGKEDYKLIVNVRNPYPRMQSLYAWAKAVSGRTETFSEWLDKLSTMPPWVCYEQRLEGQAYTAIRLEYRQADLAKLEWPEINLEQAGSNRYANEFGERPIYTEETAEKVGALCFKQFELFGYDFDSWQSAEESLDD